MGGGGGGWRTIIAAAFLGSALSSILMGVAYFANIHHLAYFIVVQIMGGLMQVWCVCVGVVCVCACLHCMCVYVCVFILYVCICIYMYMYICVCTCIHMCMCICVSLCTHVARGFNKNIVLEGAWSIALEVDAFQTGNVA